MQGVDDPDGATNEVFLRAFRGIDRFEGDETQLRSWLFTIAHNLVVDERRRAGRRPRSVPVEAVPERVVPGGDPGELVGAAARLRSLLAELPEAQRDVIVLRILSDLPIAEVARLTGRRPGAVKALQHRALARLRRALDREAVSR